MAGKYEAAGTGLSSYITRKNVYTAVIVVAAIVVAALVTIGFVTMDDIKSFIELTVYLVGVLGGVAGLIAAALARNNVEPPASIVDRDPNLRADPTGTHGL